MPYIKFPAGVFVSYGPGPVKMPPGKFIFSGPLETSEDCFIEGTTLETQKDDVTGLVEAIPGNQNIATRAAD